VVLILFALWILAAVALAVKFGLAVGGVIAAPFGAWACKKVPHKPMMVLVGALIMGMSIRTIWKSL
jgi:uncharacterized membrane protein YfcA